MPAGGAADGGRATWTVDGVVAIEPMDRRRRPGRPRDLRRGDRGRRRDLRDRDPGVARVDRVASEATAGSWRGSTAGSSAGRPLPATRRVRSTPASPGRASTSPRRRADAASVRALLAALIPATEAAGLWTLIAGVQANNPASLALHERAGFRRIGVQERIGRDPSGRLARRRAARTAEPDGRHLSDGPPTAAAYRSTHDRTSDPTADRAAFGASSSAGRAPSARLRRRTSAQLLEQSRRAAAILGRSDRPAAGVTVRRAVHRPRRSRRGDRDGRPDPAGLGPAIRSRLHRDGRRRPDRDSGVRDAVPARRGRRDQRSQRARRPGRRDRPALCGRQRRGVRRHLDRPVGGRPRHRQLHRRPRAPPRGPRGAAGGQGRRARRAGALSRVGDARPPGPDRRGRWLVQDDPGAAPGRRLQRHLERRRDRRLDREPYRSGASSPPASASRRTRSSSARTAPGSRSSRGARSTSGSSTWPPRCGAS